MKRSPARALLLFACLALLLAACRPDDTLDITPSPTPTPEPSATPTPTPVPEGFVDPYEVNTAIIEKLIELLPDPLPAGEEEWKRDFAVGRDGIKSIRGVRRPAVGKEVYYYTQQGSKMSLNFAVFQTPEDALAEFERKEGLRSELVNLAQDDAYPTPNLLGAGLYGSFALFHFDNYFVEVLVEIFTTSSSPLKPLAQRATSFFEENRSAFEGAATSPEEEDG